jgi:CHAT domain-containing protein
VSSASVTYRDLPAASGSDGTALCTELITALSSDAGAAGIPQLLRRAYDALIAPVADVLPAATDARVAIVPSGALFRIPFAALTDAAGRPLIERFALFAAPAVRMLQLLHERTAVPTVAIGDAFIMANPVMPEKFAWGGSAFELGPLLGAESEATAIGKLLNVKPLIGPDATRANVLHGISNAGVVHLATHGLLSDAIGSQSAIVVTADDRNDPATGLLTADQLSECAINAGLVVLSACSTGVGRISGDGVAALYRALHVAGASSVVASLWPISDDATLIFMQRFYREALRSNDYAASLQKAMLATRRQYPDAIDWAAFMLSGLPAATLAV